MINYDLPWNPMRIVQRHGRIDRIGSKHDYVYLGLFFPAERLDALLELEARLEAKLALADAAVGAGEVLPGRGRAMRSISPTTRSSTSSRSCSTPAGPALRYRARSTVGVSTVRSTWSRHLRRTSSASRMDRAAAS